MEKIKLHQITDGPLELISYRPDIIAKDEIEYRYKLAIYLHEIGVCDSCLFERKYFEINYLTPNNPRIPRLMDMYLLSGKYETEEFYDYLDCYPLLPTCRYLAEARCLSDHYIANRFKSGKFTIDNLVEMVEVYGMGGVISCAFGEISDHILSTNGGDVTTVLRLKDIIGVNVDAFTLAVSIAHCGSYDAFKYITSFPDIWTYTMLNNAYCISSDRLGIVVGYFLKDGKSVEDFLINLEPSSIYSGDDNDVNMVKCIIEKFNPDLSLILRDAQSGDVIDIIEKLIENEV